MIAFTENKQEVQRESAQDNVNISFKETSRSIKNTHNANITCVTKLKIEYKRSEIIIFNVAGEVIYSLYDGYVCLEYLCLHQYKLSNKYQCFKNTTFDDF